MRYKVINLKSHKVNLKYPKFLLLFITIILAYQIYSERDYAPLHDGLMSLGYIGTFIAGMLFAYGFTAAPATAILLILAKEQNLIFAGLVAGIGALAADLLIFKFIRLSFKGEIRKLSREKIFQYIGVHSPGPLKKYLLLVSAGFIIASPLPDEIGVSLLAAVKSVSIKIFALLSYILNTAGLLIILLIGSVS